jgi:polysaccharide export outer membrane protein
MIKTFNIFLLLLLAAPVFSQTSSVSPESLLIGPGDKLHVLVFDTPEMDQVIRVSDDGEAPVLFLGPVALAGKTPEDAAQTISKLLVQKNLMQHPQVSVSIEQFGTQDVSVVGEVNHPGSYEIVTARSVLDLLAMAGGLSEFADRHIVIQRRDSHLKPEVYFVSNDPSAAIGSAVMVSPGDKVIVPRVGMAYVLGDVGRPGGYPLSNNDARTTLLQMLAMSGAPNKTAITSQIRLMRRTANGYVNVPIHVNRINAGKDPDPVLAADDVVTVPFSFTKNFLMSGSTIASSIAASTIYAVH